MRYGSLFKTSLVGMPVIVTTNPEFSHFILQEEGSSVEFWYTETFMKIFGQQNLCSSAPGSLHKYVRGIVLDHFGPERQKAKLLSEMEDMVRKNLAIWSAQDSVELKEVVTEMSFGIGAKKLMSYDQSKYSDNLIDKFSTVLQAVISFPLAIPGFAYHRCLKDQIKGLALIKDIVKERFNSGKKHGDLLDVIVEDMKKDKPTFTQESTSYLLFAVLFASFETVSLALTSAVKFISEHPSVLNELTNEHEQILKNRVNRDSPLTWTEYKSMTFTSHVIDETLRIANIAPFLLRKAIRDIQIDGYTIPAGWTVMVYPAALHLNPEKYNDALTFNPWRWKGKGSNTASKNFMVFGGGMRVCAGAEFAKLQMAVVLHFLVTKYRWTKIKGGDVVKTPAVMFPNGMHIKVTKRD